MKNISLSRNHPNPGPLLFSQLYLKAFITTTDVLTMVPTLILADETNYTVDVIASGC